MINVSFETNITETMIINKHKMHSNAHKNKDGGKVANQLIYSSRKHQILIP